MVQLNLALCMNQQQRQELEQNDTELSSDLQPFCSSSACSGSTCRVFSGGVLDLNPNEGGEVEFLSFPVSSQIHFSREQKTDFCVLGFLIDLGDIKSFVSEGAAQDAVISAGRAPTFPVPV